MDNTEISKDNLVKDTLMTEEEFCREWNKVCTALKASGTDLSKIKIGKSKFTVLR